MKTDDASDYLKREYKYEDWFEDVETDASGRLIVCVNSMHPEIDNIPDFVDGKQVLVHFSYPKTKYVQASQASQINSMPSKEKQIEGLSRNLSQLKRICGYYTLQDILHEVRDGNNAITNMSSRFPEVRTEMEKLYEQFGFETIHNALN